MEKHQTRCACYRSLAFICGSFAADAVVLLLAEDRCLDAGGRLSDAAWTCESATGAINSLWGLVTADMVAFAVMVGAPVYFAFSVFGRRWIFRYGKHND